MKIKFIVELGNIDCHGDKITNVSAETLILLLDGVTIPQSVLITKDFNPFDVIGTGTVTMSNGALVCNAELNDDIEVDVGNLYPAISYITEHSLNMASCRLINKCRLISVSLGSNPNADENIKTLKEQSNKNQ